MDARCFPLASPASAGNQEPGKERTPEARPLRDTGGGPGEPGGGGTAAREPRGGGSVCSEASLTTLAGNAPPTAPAGASLPHGPGGLGLNETRELHLCTAQERSLSARPGPRGHPTASGPSVRGRPGPQPPHRSYYCPRPPLGPHRQAAAAPRTDREEAVAALGPDCGGVLIAGGGGGRTRPSPPRNTRAARRERLSKTPYRGSQTVKTDTRAAFREVRRGSGAGSSLTRGSSRWRVLQAATESRQEPHNRRRPGPLPAA